MRLPESGGFLSEGFPLVTRPGLYARWCRGVRTRPLFPTSNYMTTICLQCGKPVADHRKICSRCKRQKRKLKRNLHPQRNATRKPFNKRSPADKVEACDAHNEREGLHQLSLTGMSRQRG